MGNKLGYTVQLWEYMSENLTKASAGKFERRVLVGIDDAFNMGWTQVAESRLGLRNGV